MRAHQAAAAELGMPAERAAGTRVLAGLLEARASMGQRAERTTVLVEALLLVLAVQRRRALEETLLSTAAHRNLGDRHFGG